MSLARRLLTRLAGARASALACESGWHDWTDEETMTVQLADPSTLAESWGRQWSARCGECGEPVTVIRP